MQFNKYNQNFKVSANVMGSISMEQHPTAVSIVSAQRPLIFCCSNCYLSGGALDITAELSLPRSRHCITGAVEQEALLAV